MKHIDWSSFFTDILSVVLGIAITFGIQGLIDRGNEKKDVRSALELVRDELSNNTENLQEVMALIASEKRSAQSLRDNAGKLDKCPVDSVVVWNSCVGSEYFFTVTVDALELLKSSSLFQKINDKNLALSIIRAYDLIEADAKAFNSHEQYKISLFMDANTDKAKKASLVNDGLAFFKVFYSSPEADYFLKSVVEMSDDTFISSNIPEIESTIAGISARLK